MPGLESLEELLYEELKDAYDAESAEEEAQQDESDLVDPAGRDGNGVQGVEPFRFLLRASLSVGAGARTPKASSTKCTSRKVKRGGVPSQPNGQIGLELAFSAERDDQRAELSSGSCHQA